MEKDVITGNFYNKYETKNPIELLLMGNFKKKFIKSIEKLSIENIYEIGAGEGYLLQIIQDTIPSFNLFGSDIDFGLVSNSNKNTDGIRWVINSAEFIPLSTNSIDLLLASEVLEHLQNPHLFLLECQRIQAKYYFFSVPFEPLWRILNIIRGKYIKNLGNTPGHINHFSRKKIFKLIDEYLLVEEISLVFPWIFVMAKNKQ